MAFGFDDILMGVGGQLIGGLLSSDSAENAANIQAGATNQAANATLQGQQAAINENRRQFDLMRGDSAPYRRAGSSAVGRLAELLGLGSADAGNIPVGYVSPPRPGTGEQFQWNGASWVDMAGNPVAKWDADSAQSLSEKALASTTTQGDTLNSPLLRNFTLQDFYDDPVTQLSLKFGMEEGEKAINNAARARGNINSGGTLKELTRYGTDYGGQQAGASRGRFMENQSNIYNKLAGLAGTGQTAMQNSNATGAQIAGNNASIYSGTGNTLGNLYSNLGNARGAASIAGGNALGGAFNNIGNWYNQQQTLDKIIAGRGGSTGGTNSMPDFYT